MAARARADAAFEQYVKKYGEGDVTGRASAVAKASSGEGYTSKELKAQLHKALLEYRNIYGKSQPNSPVGGSCTADEIVLGEKG